MTDPKYMRPGHDFAVGKAIEECWEVNESIGRLLASIGKTIQWGWDSFNPELPPEQQETNTEWVIREISDLRGALDNLEREIKANPQLCGTITEYKE